MVVAVLMSGLPIHSISILLMQARYHYCDVCIEMFTVRVERAFLVSFHRVQVSNARTATGVFSTPLGTYTQIASPFEPISEEHC